MKVLSPTDFVLDTIDRNVVSGLEELPPTIYYATAPKPVGRKCKCGLTVSSFPTRSDFRSHIENVCSEA